AQRVKLASELQKRSTGRTVYVLDEPTTGLHFEDIRKLLGVLQRLVDQGNSVFVIEHNLDVIKVSDWVIDLGPEGGNKGGYLVAEGTPEQVAAVPESHTGRFLAPVLEGRAVAVGRKAAARPGLHQPLTTAESKAASRAVGKASGEKATVEKKPAKKATSAGKKRARAS
ncbi:MAG: excinuclease ABC subunit A, partial [Nocardioidaceae bacterium]|nr:excinuclease ABC subunit A [Nocardioidaceae bacterium]